MAALFDAQRLLDIPKPTLVTKADSLAYINKVKPIPAAGHSASLGWWLSFFKDRSNLREEFFTTETQRREQEYNTNVTNEALRLLDDVQKRITLNNKPAVDAGFMGLDNLLDLMGLARPVEGTKARQDRLNQLEDLRARGVDVNQSLFTGG